MKVFISYRREDGGWAGLIRRDLKEGRPDKFAVFRDVEDIPLGAEFSSDLRDNIDNSDVILVMIAQNWVSRAEKGDLFIESDWIRKELLYAIEKQKILLPVFIEKANFPELPNELRSIQSINAIQIQNRSYDADIIKLRKAISDHASKEQARRVTARQSGIYSVLKLATQRISQIPSINDDQVQDLEKWLQPESPINIPRSLSSAGFKVAEPNPKIYMKGISYKAMQFKDKLRLQLGMSSHNMMRKAIMVYDALESDNTGRIVIAVFDKPSTIGDDILRILDEPKDLSQEYRLPYISVFFSPVRSEKRFMQTYYPYALYNGNYIDKGVDSNIFATLFELQWLGSANYTQNELQQIHDRLIDAIGNYQIIHASEFPNEKL